MKTYQPKHKDIERSWHLMDASGAVLGRMATRITTYLTGKHKPTYSRHMDMGDDVVVINAKEGDLTGRKKKQKVYQKHSGYPGGFKEIKFSQMIERHPERVIEMAVSGMLAGNRLKKPRMRRLKIFADETHPYEDKLNVQK